MRYPGFVGPSATSRSKIACDDRLVNLYPEKNESGTGAAPYTLYRVPGYQTWCDLGTTSPVRGVYTLNGVAWAVAGTNLYQLPGSLGGTAITLATGLANPDDSPVTMASSGDGSFQLVITAGSQLYNFDLRTNTLELIPDISATSVLFMDATFFALDPNSSTLYASDPENGAGWDPLAVSQRTTAPDKMIAMARVGTELVTFGSQTTTPWYNNGGEDFPLIPNPSIFIQRGIRAPWSLKVSDGSAIWLEQGTDGALTVRKMQGYTPQRVSTHPAEYDFGQLTNTTNAEALLYEEEGHDFYVLNFDEGTWCYDITEGLWHERGPFVGNDYERLAIRGHVYVNGVHLVGSSETGVIYQQSLSLATNTDGATGIRWNRRAPHLVNELRRTTYDLFRLHAEVGVGLPTGQGSDPQVALRYSDDGGQSFGNVLWESLGAIGASGTLVDWRMLGQGRDRVFDLYGSDPVITALTDAYLQIRPGTS